MDNHRGVSFRPLYLWNPFHSWPIYTWLINGSDPITTYIHSDHPSMMTLLPRKLTWNPKMELWNMRVLSNKLIFRSKLVFGAVRFYVWGSQTSSSLVTGILERCYCQDINHIFTGHMGVSENSGTPKWMVYNGNSY